MLHPTFVEAKAMAMTLGGATFGDILRRNSLLLVVFSVAWFFTGLNSLNVWVMR